MESPRNDKLFKFIRGGTSLFVNLYHKLEIEGLDEIPDGAFLAYVKHQYLTDISVEGDLMRRKRRAALAGENRLFALMKRNSRVANWVMRYTLPHSGEKIGGILTYRPIDFKKARKRIKELEPEMFERLVDASGGDVNYQFMLEDVLDGIPERFAEFKKDFRYVNNRMFELSKSAYSRGEGIFLHAEETRIPHKMGKVNMDFANYTRGLQDELGIDIPLVLIGMDYKKPYVPRSKIVVKIKQLDWNTPNLEKVVKKEMARLSGL